jgi:hypothetical protein
LGPGFKLLDERFDRAMLDLSLIEELVHLRRGRRARQVEISSSICAWTVKAVHIFSIRSAFWLPFFFFCFSLSKQRFDFVMIRFEQFDGLLGLERLLASCLLA